MCFSRPAPPPPTPQPIMLPQAPSMPNIVSKTVMQAGPKTPRAQGTPTENPLLMRRGKRSLVIPMNPATGA
jgi:hypothetical protein